MSRDDGRVRIWGASWIFAFYGAVMIFYAGVSLVLLVVGLDKNRTAPLVTGLFMSAFTLPVAASFYGRFGRPVVLDRQAVSIPNAFTRTVVPLSAISGIGLVYRNVPRTPGWALEIWGPGEAHTPVRRFLLASLKAPRLAIGVSRRVNGQRDLTIPLLYENAGYLAASKPGRVAGELYLAALHAQGPYGPIVTEARQKAVHFDANSPSSALAWWSPDGLMGRAHGMPPADPTKLADPSEYQPTGATP